MIAALAGVALAPFTAGSLEAAQEYWGQRSCSPVVRFAPRRADAVTAAAEPLVCRVTVHAWGPRSRSLLLCYVLTHEVGHLLGYGHAHPDPVMRAQGTGPLPAPCYRLDRTQRHRRWHGAHGRRRPRGHRALHRRLRQSPPVGWAQLRERGAH